MDGFWEYWWGWVLSTGLSYWHRCFCYTVSRCAVVRCPTRHMPFEICQSRALDFVFLSKPENHKACAGTTYTLKVITFWKLKVAWNINYWRSSRTYLYLSVLSENLEFWGLAARFTRALVYTLRNVINYPTGQILNLLLLNFTCTLIFKELTEAYKLYKTKYLESLVERRYENMLKTIGPYIFLSFRKIF